MIDLDKIPSSSGVSEVIRNEDDVIEAQVEDMPEVPTPDLAVDGDSWERAQANSANEFEVAKAEGKTEEEIREERKAKADAAILQLGFN